MFYLRQVAIYLCRAILLIFYIFPVKHNRIIFMSFNGKQYSCNPKYIFEYLKKNYGNRFEYIWVLNNVKKYKSLEDENVRIVKNYTFGFLYNILTSKIIVSNNSIDSYLPLRKNQYYIETWHGGGAYKKTGVDIKKGNFKVYPITMKYVSKKITGFISSSAKFTKTKSQGHLVPPEKFWECGMPRNDLLFKVRPDIIKKIKDYYDVHKDIKIALYAPTLRDDKDVSMYSKLDIIKCLNSLTKRFGGRWVLFFRTHHSISPETNLNHAINVSDYDDMQELLYVSDVLITDYSSCMWDFSLTKKPCFVFAPDAEKYQQERDFYTPMSQWPYPIAKNNDELVNNIMNFDEVEYINNVKKHHMKQGSYENGNATECVVKKMLELLTENCT